MKRGYQFVTWFPEWVGLGLTRHDPAVTDWAYVYAWHLRLGFWELRRWSALRPPDKA